jgi:hypothetical protein
MQPLPSVETSKAITHRHANASDVLAGKVDLRSYPHRYLILVAYRHFGGMPSLLTAVEWLESQAWELVNIYADDTVPFNAVMRRRLG